MRNGRSLWHRGENKKPFLVAERNAKVKQSPWKEKRKTTEKAEGDVRVLGTW